MTKVKRMLAIFMTLAMVLSMTFAMGLTSYAAESYDESLVISGLDNDDVAHVYKVIEWVGDASGNVKGWKATSAFASVLTTDVLNQIFFGVKADPDAEPPVEAKEPGITSELAGQLAKLATSGGFDLTAADNKVTIDTTAEGRGPGLYMAIITPSDADTVYNPVFVGADYNKEKSGNHAVVEDAVDYSDESAAKKSKVELTKTAATEEDAWDDGNSHTTAVGDTVKFTVKTTIPGYGDVYTNPTFKVTDKLDKLKLKKDTVTITKPTGLVEGADKDYTITKADDGYTISFTAEYLKKVAVPTDVEIRYEAIVTSDAADNVNPEKNEVTTEFSHNPSDENDHGFKKDTTQHYTFSIDADGLGCTTTQQGKKTSEIVKNGVDANGDPILTETTTSKISPANSVEGPLSGAKFKLYTDTNKTEYVPKDKNGTALAPLVIVSDTDGRLKVDGASESGIHGLDAGTYFLEEVEAPAGYIRDTQLHKIVISAQKEEKTITEYTTDGTTWISQAAYDELSADAKKAYKSYTYKTDVLKSYTIVIDDTNTAASYTFTNNGTDAEIDWTVEPPVELPFPITNTQGTELPSTGGIGTVIFYVLGAALVIGCGIVLVSRRRMQKSK